MKIPGWNILIFLVLFSSCTKENITKFPGSNRLDTTIYASDTLLISFGYFGDEEGISIISAAKHAKSCVLLNELWEERILQYIPEEFFLGTDSVTLVSMRGSDGASPPSDVDTISVVISVVLDDFHKNLIGKWNWTVSCGGFTGGCWYPGPDNTEQIAFSYDMRYQKWYNDSLILDTRYAITDSLKNGASTIYVINLEDGYDTYYRFTGDILNVQGGDFWMEYERVE